MAISLIDNLKIQNKKQNVERDSFVSIADMVGYSPNYLPNLFHAMCEETGKMYVYNVNNNTDPVLGRWREYGSGVGTDEDEDRDKLVALEKEAAKLRTELSRLEV